MRARRPRCTAHAVDTTKRFAPSCNDREQEAQAIQELEIGDVIDVTAIAGASSFSRQTVYRILDNRDVGGEELAYARFTAAGPPILETLVAAEDASYGAIVSS